MEIHSFRPARSLLSSKHLKSHRNTSVVSDLFFLNQIWNVEADDSISPCARVQERTEPNALPRVDISSCSFMDKHHVCVLIEQITCAAVTAVS